jgi:hypothetical protein
MDLSDQREKPGHLARRFQQIAVAVFLHEMAKIGSELTPVQYSALAAVTDNPGIDQVTLAGLIAYDRATIAKCSIASRKRACWNVASLNRTGDNVARMPPHWDLRHLAPWSLP